MNRTAPIRALLFDLDGTLLDRKRSFSEYAGVQWENFGLQAFGVERDRYVSAAIELDRNGHEPRERLFRGLVERFDLRPTLATELVEDFHSGFPSACYLYPDVLPTLRVLRAQRLRLGLITNGPESMQRRKIEHLGISSHLDVMLISGVEGVSKPDPAIFERAAERLGVRVEEAAFVGDHPEADVGGARRAGMRAIWRRDPASGDVATADAVIEEIGEVLDVLLAWGAPVPPSPLPSPGQA